VAVENAYEHSRRAGFRKALKEILFSEKFHPVFSAEERESILRKARGDFHAYDVYLLQLAAKDFLKNPELTAKERALLKRISSEDPKAARKFVALLEKQAPRVFDDLRYRAAKKYGKGRVTVARYYPRGNYIAGTEFSSKGSVAHELMHMAYHRGGRVAETVNEPLAYAVEHALTGERESSSQFEARMRENYNIYRASLAAKNYVILRKIAEKFGPKAALAVARQLGAVEHIDSKVRSARARVQDGWTIFKEYQLRRLKRKLRRLKR